MTMKVPPTLIASAGADKAAKGVAFTGLGVCRRLGLRRAGFDAEARRRNSVAFAGLRGAICSSRLRSLSSLRIASRRTK